VRANDVPTFCCRNEPIVSGNVSTRSTSTAIHQRGQLPLPWIPTILPRILYSVAGILVCPPIQLLDHKAPVSLLPSKASCLHQPFHPHQLPRPTSPAGATLGPPDSRGPLPCHLRQWVVAGAAAAAHRPCPLARPDRLTGQSHRHRRQQAAKPHRPAATSVRRNLMPLK